jgi:hypothetical protein
LDPDHYVELHDEEEEFVVVGDSDEEEDDDEEESLVDTTTTTTTTTAITNGRPLIGILSQPNCWTRRVTHYSSNCSCNCSIICQRFVESERAKSCLFLFCTMNLKNLLPR